MVPSFARFPPPEISVRILVAVGAGLLVGLEREWSHKVVGSRTFTLISLFGALAALISPAFVIAGFGAVVALFLLTGIRAVVRGRKVEPTTSAALMVTFALGVLAGEGHVFTPAAAAILMTLLLSLKPQLSRFAIGLSQEEVRGAILLALIAFVIYPVLPNHTVDPWRLLNPRELWLTIILIAAIGFINYILLRLFSARGLYYTAIFGGLVNSTAAIAELSPLLVASGEGLMPLVIAVNLLTLIAMFARNLILLAIFSPAAGLLALLPIVAMVAGSTLLAWRQHGRAASSPRLNLGSPLELTKVIRFGALFLLIQSAAAAGQRFFGASGLIVVSFVGGFASSASSTAAAATLAKHGSLDPREAAICTVLASIASMLVNLPIIFRHFNDRRLFGKLALSCGGISLLGLAALVAVCAL